MSAGRARVWVLLVLAGCATARIPRLGTDPPPVDPDPALESAYQQTLERATRSQSVYDLFDTRLFVHATWESSAFSEARINRLARFRAMPIEEERSLLEAERQRLKDVVEFHLAVHANDPKMDDFDRVGSMWRVALVADGRELTPQSIERIGRTTTDQRSIYTYMEPFWVGYRVRFIKPGATTSMVLKIASSVGKAELSYSGE